MSPWGAERSSTRDAGPRPGRAVVDPADRGSLHIDQAVLRRIVEHTANQAPGTLAGGLASLGGRAAHGARARISGSDQGTDLDIAIDLALAFPAPVRATIDEVEDRVCRAVRRLTGRRVRSVSVTVSALLPGPRPRVE